MLRMLQIAAFMSTVMFLANSGHAATKIVVIDNGGTLQAKEGSFAAKKALLNKLVTDNTGYFGESEIAVILTTTGNVEFRQPASSVPATIKALLPDIDFKPTCNSLPEAFAAATDLFKSLPPDQLKGAEIHLFSSLISTPSPCHEFVANVPQPVPAELDVAFLAKKGIPVTVYWAEGKQKRAWERFFSEQGVVANIKTVIETRSALGVEAE